MDKLFDLSEIRHVKRVVIGNTDPQRIMSQEEIDKQVALLNSLLSKPPKGRIIGSDRGFYLLNIADHQVVLAYTSYLIGWTREPI